MYQRPDPVSFRKLNLSPMPDPVLVAITVTVNPRVVVSGANDSCIWSNVPFAIDPVPHAISAVLSLTAASVYVVTVV
mgnify:CR=1 FL=1